MVGRAMHGRAAAVGKGKGGEGRRSGRRGWRIALLGLLLAGSALRAGEDPVPTPTPKPRPRIGLVLGGGGAKGGAHVGVLKVLEQLRVPVDCIAGTSMGSIVGGAYAAGLSADELQLIINDVNWKGVLSSTLREDIPYHRRSLDSVFTLGLEVGLKRGAVVMPDAMVSSHQIEALLRTIVPPGNLRSFDQLPIPFRAVATDLENGSMKVFDKGDLSVALRASMAVPGAFAPVEVDGRLYVDGMLVRNLPVDVARRMGADIIISVTVSNPPRKREDLGGMMSVAGQSMDIAIEGNERTQLQTLTPQDTAIPVLLRDITSSDFNKVPEAIPIGEAAARELSTLLSRYSLSPADYAAYRRRVKGAVSPREIRVDEIRLDGFIVTNPQVMRTFLRIKPGDVYDPARADEDATRLVARGDFSAVKQHVEKVDGKNILVFTAKEKQWGPNYLMFDLSLSTGFKGGTAWGLRMDLQNRWLNRLGGELRTSVQVGEPFAAVAEFYQPLDLNQRFFVAPSAAVSTTPEQVFLNDQPTAELTMRRYLMSLEAGIALGTWGEYRVGAYGGKSTSTVNVGDPVLVTPGRYDLGGWITRFGWDTLDKPVWPTRGTHGKLDLLFSETDMGAEWRYQLASGSAGLAVPFRGGVWSGTLKGGTSFGSDVPYYDQFKLGGLFNFSGYQPDQLVGSEYILATTSLRWKVATISEMLTSAVFVGASLEGGNVYKQYNLAPNPTGILCGGSVFVSVDTKFGPLCLAYGLSEGGHGAFYLYIGSSFDLFRP